MRFLAPSSVLDKLVVCNDDNQHCQAESMHATIEFISEDTTQKSRNQSNSNNSAKRKTNFFFLLLHEIVLLSFILLWGNLQKKIPYFGICEYIFHDNLLAIFVTNLINFLLHILHFITLKNTFYNI